MSEKLIMNVLSNAGYAADQVNGMTLADLRDMIEDAITSHGEDAEVVLQDAGNAYGARYGRIIDTTLELEGDEDDE